MNKPDFRPYRFTFTVFGNKLSWIRFGNNSKEVFKSAKEDALREFPKARSFMIESDRDSAGIRKDWSLGVDY